VSIERNIKINITGKDSGTAKLDNLEKAIKRVAMGYLSLKGAQKAIEFVKLGAQAEAVENRFVRFAGGADQAAKYLAALNAGADDTIDRMTAMAQASRMLETHMTSNTREMEIAGAMVAKLGNQTRTTESRMQSLTLLLANQSIRLLDEFGLSVENVQKRQGELEKQGYSTVQAFKTAVFEEAQAALVTLGDTSGLAATKMGQTEAAFKNAKTALARMTADLVNASGALDSVASWANNIATVTEAVKEHGFSIQSWAEAYKVYWQSGLDSSAAVEQFTKNLEDNTAAERELVQQQDILLNSYFGIANIVPQVTVSVRELNNEIDRYYHLIPQASEVTRYAYTTDLPMLRDATTAITQALLNSLSALGTTDQAMFDYVSTLVQGTDMASGFSKYVDDGTLSLREQRAAAMDTTAAMLDLAMSYASYYQQAGASATSYYGGLGDAEARYQERVKQIQGMGAGDLGGGGGATPGREFDRADIERGLRIQKAQLAEAEAKQEGWDMGEKLEGMSWEDISREDRKWLTEHGKTLEDLQAEHVKTGEDITELERAQMDDRIEDLKGEIEETERILKQGHYDQHVMRVAAAQVDTAALLAEAAIRRDEEIAILEGSRIQQEAINQQSLGRLELASFDSWAARNLDTETATAEELRQVELMRLDIALKYGLITADTLTNTTDQWTAWDTMFLNIESGADTAKTAVDNLINAIKSLPSSGDIYWGGILPPGTIEGQQSGGSVLGGRPYMVGEAGPELFIPRQAGYVYNAQQSKQITSARDSHDTYIVSSDRAWQQIDEERRARARAAFTEKAGMS